VNRGSTLVLGAGPVGLVASLYATSAGARAEIWTSQLPQPGDPLRIESLPAQIVPLLVEIGVKPSELGIGGLESRRYVAWGQREPIALPSPPMVHVARPALDLALLRLAEGQGVRIIRRKLSPSTDWSAIRAMHETVLDATGRSAVTVLERVRPPQPITARVHAVSGAFDGAFMIAALPGGYVYRLGNALGLVVGLVGSTALLQAAWDDVLAGLRDLAPWICADLLHAEARSDFAGAASAQWGVPHPDIQPIGDASFARDALASQGLMNGVTQAIHAARSPATARQRERAAPAAWRAHLAEIGRTIRQGGLAGCDNWASYLGFVAAQSAQLEDHA